MDVTTKGWLRVETPEVSSYSLRLQSLNDWEWFPGEFLSGSECSKTQLFFRYEKLDLFIYYGLIINCQVCTSQQSFMESRVHDDIIVIVTRAHIVIVTSLLLWQEHVMTSSLLWRAHDDIIVIVTRAHDDIIVIVTEAEERVTSYSPVVKAESFMLTTNSTPSRIAAKFSTEP